ncbi:hypothetical protein S83_055001, partial [Arachis hypogaea]
IDLRHISCKMSVRSAQRNCQTMKRRSKASLKSIFTPTRRSAIVLLEVGLREKVATAPNAPFATIPQPAHLLVSFCFPSLHFTCSSLILLLLALTARYPSLVVVNSGKHTLFCRAISNFAFSFSIISILTGVTTLYNIGLNYGGPFSMIYGWLIAGFFTMFVALSVDEICSAYPTSGGLYYWSAKLAGPTWAPFASWITGWFNIIGQTTSVDFSLAQLIQVIVLLSTGEKMEVDMKHLN